MHVCAHTHAHTRWPDNFVVNNGNILVCENYFNITYCE